MRRMDGSPDFMRNLRKRIRQRLRAVGKSARQASIDAGMHPGAISEILREPKGESTKGTNQNPSIATLERISRSLLTTVDFLTGKSESEEFEPEIRGMEKGIPVVGDVEAGVFREMTSPEPWLEDYDFERIIAPKSNLYPGARHFALRVRGDSMNAAKPKPILDGEIAIFVDVVDAEISITEGRIYLVRKTEDSGQKWEWTLKRARVFRDRIELTPESTNPKHKPVVIRTNGTPPEDEVEIAAVGLLTGTFNSYEQY